MAITVKHLKVSTVPDAGDDTLVEPSDWNADHTLTGLGTAAELDAGVPNGVATLDAGGKVPVSELPAAVLGALSYQGTWDASTNTPTLTSSVGTKGYYYVVNVAGNTNLNGITDWLVGDWAVYNGTVWQKVDNTETVTSVNGQTGAVVLTTTDVAEGTNLYYTDARARASISAGTGISYDNTTGVVTNAAPDQTVALTDGTAIDVTGTYPNFTINNTAPDQVVSLTGAGTTTVSGTYPNFTITSADSKVGDVVGPASATDNAVARYDTTTGKLIQNSLVIIDDTGSVTGVNALTAQSLTVNNNATLGSSNTDTLDVRARISSDLDPETNNAKDIGSSGRNWRDAFFGRTVHTVNLELTGTTSFDGSQGTAGQVLTSAGTGATPTWTTPTTGTVTSVTGTAPVVSSGGNTPAISMAAATGSVNGYLTSTDWNTFNNKTSNTGTVTSVGGTGTVNGLTLSGTVTTTGNLTLGGTLDLSSPPAIGGTTPAAGNFTTLGATGVATFSAGTVSAPAITTTGDTNTGMYFPAADTIAFAEGGVESMRINSSGNIGINTASPLQKLDVAGSVAVSVAGASFYYNADNTNSYFVGGNNGATGGPNAVLRFQQTGVGERMRLDASGNLGINTSSPVTTLNVSSASVNGSGGDNFGLIQATYTGTTTTVNAGITVKNYQGTSQFMQWEANGLRIGSRIVTNTGLGNVIFTCGNDVERMRIDSSGIVTMNAYGVGAATFSAAGVISSVSDETWKTKDGVPTNPEAMLQKLEAGYWFYNEEKAPIFGSDRQLGFYAQNVHEAIGEEAAPTPEEGKPWGYYDRSVLAITVMSLKNALNSIQELKTELDSVKAELQTLKGS